MSVRSGAQTSSPAEPLLPPVKTWKARDLGHPAQTWALAQGSNHFLHAGIIGGILTWDGYRWHFTPSPDNRTVRSLVSGPDGKLYWGTNNQYGFLATDAATGKPAFVSVSDSLDPSLFPFGTAWKMVSGTQSVAVKLNRRIDIITPDTIFTTPLARNYDFLGYSNNQFIGNADQLGFFTISDTTLQFLPKTQALSADYIEYIEPQGQDHYFFAGRKTGLGTIHTGTGTITFWKDGKHPRLLNSTLNGAIRLSDGSLLVHSLGDGIFDYSPTGVLTAHYGKKEGLASDNIKRLLATPDDNFWAATESGISFIERSSPFRYIDERLGVDQLIHSVIRFNGDLVIGSGNGLYRYDKPEGSFRVPSGFHYQVFDLKQVGNRLLGATGGGIIDFTTGEKVLAPNRSRFLFQPAEAPMFLMAGTIHGVYTFKQTAGTLQPHFRIPDFDFDTAGLLETNGRFWINTHQDGAYVYPLIRDTPDPSRRPFRVGSGPGFESGFSHFFIWKDRLLLQNSAGVFHVADSVNVSPIELSLPVDLRPISKIRLSASNTWFLLCSDGQRRVRMVIGDPDSGWDYIQPEGLSPRRYDFTWIENDSTWWAGGDDGLVRFNPARLTGSASAQRTGLSMVILNDTDTLWNGLFTGIQPPHIGQIEKNNILTVYPAIRFRFSEGSPAVQYTTSDDDPRWSGYLSLSSLRFQPGTTGQKDLAFQVRSPDGQDYQPAIIHYEVPIPFHLRWWAWLTYLLLTGWLLFLMLKWQRRSYLRRQEKLEAEIARQSAQLATRQKLTAIGQISAGLAHELNNALAIIQANMDLSDLAIRPLATSGHPDLSADELADFKSALGGIRLGAERIESIVRSMQKASNPHQSDVIPSQINEIVRMVIDFTQPQYPSYGIVFEPDQTIPVILTNPAAVNVAVYNLLINAIEATARRTQSTGYCPPVRIRTQKDESAQEALIYIDDHGDGIPAGLENRVFDPFFTTKPTGKNRGMGLNEAWELLKLAGGTFELKNRPEGGTRVIIQIPLVSRSE
ncbi:MAG: HAMP domain-containing histidine kinase [Bacteroidetes bacterium]|nr:HAMP domain-containing histidine kinase [Bacteroidota bacterium]